MVDFNNETTISQPIKQVVAITGLQYHMDVLTNQSHYLKNKFMGIDIDCSLYQSSVITLYYQFKDSIIAYYNNKSKFKDGDHEKILKCLANLEDNALDYDEINKAFNYINTFLYEKGLTKIDDKAVYDATNPFEENRARGFK